jgi:hypothetical protein
MKPNEFKSMLMNALADGEDDGLGPSPLEKIIEREATAVLERTMSKVRFAKSRDRRKVPVMHLYDGDYHGLARNKYIAPVPQRVYDTILKAGFEIDFDEIVPGLVVMSLILPA